MGAGRRGRRALGWLAGALLLALPVHGEAQQPAWSLDVRVGVSSPKGDLGDLHDDGVFAGVGLERHLSPRWAVRIEGSFESLERGGRPDRLGGTKGPLADLWHGTALVTFEVSEPGASPWEVEVGLGGGATYFDIGGSEMIAARTGTWPTIQGILYGGFELSRRWTLFVRIDGYIMVEDQPEPQGYLSKEFALVNSGGMRIAF